MPENKSYTQLEVWKKSRELVKDVYLLTQGFPKEELYSLTNQIRRAIVSIPSNIAEGIGRNSNKETVQYLHFAKGSMYEVETQLYLAYDLRYIKLEQLNEMLLKIEESRKLLYGFIQYYKNKSG
jgi:four helix bundle protein